jgi:hypothetical protein
MINTAAQQPSGTAKPDDVSPLHTGHQIRKPHNTSHFSQTFSRLLRSIIVVLACAWIALCTAVGPIYRANASILDFSWNNALLFVITFALCISAVVILYRWALHCQGKSTSHSSRSTPTQAHAQAQRGFWHRLWSFFDSICRNAKNALLSHPKLNRMMMQASHVIIRGTNRWWKIAIILLLGWLWAYATLLVAFGADVRSQINEFNMWWANIQGMPLPYTQGFTPMDVYPTAHYLWPSNPTYLTNQHNIVLTMIYGGVVAVMRALSGSDDAGLVVLAGTQYLFAAFCLSVTAHRILTFGADHHHSETALTDDDSQRDAAAQRRQTVTGAVPRLLILVFLLCCPLVVFSTISITKSPLFAFAFVWWIGIWYQLWHIRRQNADARIPRRIYLAMAISTIVMLISVKYALYIVAVQLVVSLVADRRRWKFALVSLAVPLIIFQVMISTLVSTGTIITGDPIESKGVQLQQIARVAQRNPQGIPEDARKALEPILDLDAMGKQYFPNDADRVKSSGTSDKVTTYKWRTVSAQDMKAFNDAWLEIGLHNPVLYLDAFLAKSYGYFDVTDPPYVSMGYYVNNHYVQDSTSWIKNWLHDWRNSVVQNATNWGNTPVLGWFTHGNFWVVLTLLLMSAQLLLRRGQTLAYQCPLILLMGVMVIAPANNFERHMLPIAFSFVFIAIAFYQESHFWANTDADRQRG